MKTILVSIISDQTIPNIQFIKEKQAETTEYLFVTTVGMEKKEMLTYLLKAHPIDAALVKKIVVDEFSYQDIENELQKVVSDENRYVVNLTGGTKIMSLAVNDFFKNYNAELFYLTGRNNNYLKIFPGKTRPTLTLKSTINLDEYLMAYGFDVQSKGKLTKERAVSNVIFDYFLNKIEASDFVVLNELRINHRDKNLNDLDLVDGLKELLAKMQFVPETIGKLSKSETKYLTGDWFEEYMYYYLKEKFDIKDFNIGTGWFIKKDESTNEFDIILIKNNSLFIYECKTSIFKDSEERQNIISETIYKSDSLKNKLGLFAITHIVTLSELNNDSLNVHLKRAEASKVIIIGKSEFKNSELLATKLK